MEQGALEKRKKVIYELMCDDLYVPMRLRDIAILLDIPKEEREELKEVLQALIDEGKIELSRRGKYDRASGKICSGVFQANPRGFGFVTVEGMEEDIFIPEDEIHGAFNKDTVKVRLKSGKTGKRQEGTIIKILSRGTEEIVGTFQQQSSFGFVLPDTNRFTKDVYISTENSMGAVTGHKVVVKLTDYGSATKNPEGKVIEILGHINDPGTDILAIIKAFGLPVEFPEEVMRQVGKVPDAVKEEEKAGRKDLRHLQTVTIDGEDAKDLDDAITLEKQGEKYLLGVHIADVSHYVKENSALDKEALKRGTSTYLVDRVIPMLPHRLSNGICSLNAGEDRLALSCLMEIDKKGNVVGHEIAETLIQVDRRMSYTSVRKILEDKDEAEIKEYESFVPMFQLMEELAGILRAKRRKRGSIDFDFPETKVILDEKGHPVEIKPYERNVATKIIEDFMLIANETVAQDFYWQEMPFLYRTHDNPDPEKIAKLGMFINNFGYAIKVGQDEIHPKELQKLLEKIEDTPEEPLISRLTLRSMKQARYSPECTGHFGLAAEYYCHFTSPIRRYPDLQIHRIIKEHLKGGMPEKRQEHYHKILSEVAVQTSNTERRAEEAERETVKLKKAEYMQDKIGEIYEGVISSVTSFGMYVELPNTVEGLIHMTTLKDDYYFYDEEHYELVGEHTNHRYKLGQALKIRVAGVDELTHNIDFELAPEESEETDGEGTHQTDSEQ